MPKGSKRFTHTRAEKAKELIELAGKGSFILNFIKSKISIYPEIRIG
ncbi:MAG: hypothetical protein WCY42_02560 [Candidatus Omnitrophota bacterium]